MSKLTDTITALAQPVAERHGLTLWNVEYLHEGGERYLRVYIDRDSGVSLDDCEAVSRELEPLIDELDPIEENYFLEVSSAGAERLLKRPSDFQACMGRMALVKLYKSRDGCKEFVGTLTGYDAGAVTLTIDGVSVTFEKPDIAKTQLTIGSVG
ncbi:MAG: ribosome maturation factor RimP [Oscillospiraceae bacterium]|jgi:ribosome maturation factor RimP|nr:ribosome maturation factor RimP [Oscillospiraceae bacterium]